MKLRLVLGLLGSFGVGVGCGEPGQQAVDESSDESSVQSVHPEPAPETPEWWEKTRAEGEILQAALDAVYTPEEQAALLARAERERNVDFTGTLTPDEVRAIQTRFASQGIGTSRISFHGRMVSVDESDAYYQADTLLEDADSPVHEVEKNYVLAQISSSTPAYGAPTTAPDLFARMNGASFQFWRPALSREDFPGVRRKYFLVFEQPVVTVPSFIRNSLIDAALRVEAANSNDCLISNTFEVIDFSTWQNLSAGNQLYHYKIQVRYRPVSPNESLPACESPGAAACSTFPRSISRSYAFPPASTSAARMSFGNYLGIPSNGILTNPNITPENRRRLLAHEIGHIVGLSHPFADGATHLLVPGTATRNQDVNQPGSYESFMDYDLVDGLGGKAISADDQLALRKLYPANGCGYTHAFQTIQ